MVVRIRFGRGQRLEGNRRKNRRVAVAFAALLTPAAVMASVLGIWGVAADMKWADRFAIGSGFFSHWQVWVAAAALLEGCSRGLNRYARVEETAGTAKRAVSAGMR